MKGQLAQSRSTQILPWSKRNQFGAPIGLTNLLAQLAVLLVQGIYAALESPLPFAEQSLVFSAQGTLNASK